MDNPQINSIGEYTANTWLYGFIDILKDSL